MTPEERRLEESKRRQTQTRRGGTDICSSSPIINFF
jgi:hypothetical protein